MSLNLGGFCRPFFGENYEKICYNNTRNHRFVAFSILPLPFYTGYVGLRFDKTFSKYG